ncbi:archease [Halobellus sp. Atlit-31R]|nr:archease [Halobellus sp. Atlit-31R]
MNFELRDHTADVAVEATASDLDSLFGAVADGLAAASCDDIPPADGPRGADAEAADQTFELTVAAEGREALLFDYLDELIYERDVRGVLPVDNRAQIDRPGSVSDDEAGDGASGDEGDAAADTASSGEWRLTATYRGVPLAELDAREVKAVTYSEMRVERTATGWVAYVVFDV